jgi:hypothetical protein
MRLGGAKKALFFVVHIGGYLSAKPVENAQADSILKNRMPVLQVHRAVANVGVQSPFTL